MVSWKKHQSANLQAITQHQQLRSISSIVEELVNKFPPSSWLMDCKTSKVIPIFHLIISRERDPDVKSIE